MRISINKKIKIFLVISILCIGGIIAFLNVKESKAENCCGKCTGSANCRACKNCKYCAHCNSGGSCGVCSYSAPSPKPKSTPIPSNSEPKANSSSGSTTSTKYTVNSQTLNIRSTPSTSGTVIYTLKFGEKVTVLKLVDGKWAKVKFKNIEGYSSHQYLIH